MHRGDVLVWVLWLHGAHGAHAMLVSLELPLSRILQIPSVYPAGTPLPLLPCGPGCPGPNGYPVSPLTDCVAPVPPEGWLEAYTNTIEQVCYVCSSRLMQPLSNRAFGQAMHYRAPFTDAGSTLPQT